METKIKCVYNKVSLGKIFTLIVFENGEKQAFVDEMEITPKTLTQLTLLIDPFDPLDYE